MWGGETGTWGWVGFGNALGAIVNVLGRVGGGGNWWGAGLGSETWEWEYKRLNLLVKGRRTWICTGLRLGLVGRGSSRWLSTINLKVDGMSCHCSIYVLVPRPQVYTYSNLSVCM